MTTGSPVSRFGVNVGLCLPRRVRAACVATRPSRAPSASMTRQCRSISLPFALFVLAVVPAISLFSLVRVPFASSLAVFHMGQTQALRWCARPGQRAILRSHDLAEPLDADLSASHPEQGPHDRADHAPDDRVGLDLEPEQLALTGPLRLAHRSHAPLPPPDPPEARAPHDPA